MGFSLSRALAGAVIGATTSASGILENQLKEEAVNRQRQLELEKQKELAAYHSELDSQKQASRDAMAEAKLAKERGLFAETVKDARAEMADKGIKFGTPEGQQMIAQAFIDKGYPAQANIFFDNGQKMEQAQSNAELKKIQINAAADARRFREEDKAANREASKAAKMSDAEKAYVKQYNDILSDLEVKKYNDDGRVSGTDSTLKNHGQQLTNELLDKDPKAAVAALLQYSALVNQARGKNPGATPYEIMGHLDATADARRQAQQPPVKELSQAQVGSGQPPAVTPGMNTKVETWAQKFLPTPNADKLTGTMRHGASGSY